MTIALAAFNQALGNEDIGSELLDIQRECARAADERPFAVTVTTVCLAPQLAGLGVHRDAATGLVNLHAAMALSSLCDITSMSDAISVRPNSGFGS